MPGLIAFEHFRQPSGQEIGSTLLSVGGTFGPDATVPVPVPAHLQPPEAAQPRQRPLNLPAVAPKPGRRLDLPPSDPRLDATPPWVGPVGSAVIALIGGELAGPGTPLACGRQDRRHLVHDGLEHGGVVDVGRGHHRRQGQPWGVAADSGHGGLSPVAVVVHDGGLPAGRPGAPDRWP
jgi:hypothetical protein